MSTLPLSPISSFFTQVNLLQDQSGLKHPITISYKDKQFTLQSSPVENGTAYAGVFCRYVGKPDSKDDLTLFTGTLTEKEYIQGEEIFSVDAPVEVRKDRNQFYIYFNKGYEEAPTILFNT